MDDDVRETEPPAPDDGEQDRAEAGSGGGTEPSAGRWVVASTGHLVCVEESQR